MGEVAETRPCGCYVSLSRPRRAVADVCRGFPTIINTPPPYYSARPIHRGKDGEDRRSRGEDEARTIIKMRPRTGARVQRAVNISLKIWRVTRKEYTMK